MNEKGVHPVEYNNSYHGLSVSKPGIDLIIVVSGIIITVAIYSIFDLSHLHPTKLSLRLPSRLARSRHPLNLFYPPIGVFETIIRQYTLQHAFETLAHDDSDAGYPPYNLPLRIATAKKKITDAVSFKEVYWDGSGSIQESHWERSKR